MKRLLTAVLATLLLLTPLTSFAASDTPIMDRYGMDKQSLKDVLGIIKAESHDTYESKLATANVILNQKKMYPNNTMSEVIRIPKQWETVTNGRYRTLRPDTECLQALVDAMNGQTNVGNSVYFYNPKYCESPWHETQRYITTIGTQRYFERVA